MTTPNKITIFRIFLVPFIVVLMILDIIIINNGGNIVATYLNGINLTIPGIIASILFIIGSASDILDGYLARKNNEVTLFGKVFDPSADKILVNTVLIIMTVSGRINVIIPIIMISRDILVDTTRIALGNKKIVVPANVWGKLKTITQMVAIIMMFYLFPTQTNSSIDGIPESGNNWFFTLPIWTATVFSTISGFVYLKEAWPHIKEDK